MERKLNSIILNSGISQDILNHMKTTNQESQMEVDLEWLKKKPSVSQAKALNDLAEAHGIKTNDDLIKEAENAERVRASNAFYDSFPEGSVKK